jgi:hypothetical protein
MIGQKSTGTISTDIKPPYDPNLQLPTFMYTGGVPYQQFGMFPTVQYHAPVTYHNQTICTNYGNVTGSHSTYSHPDQNGNKN